MCSSDLGGLAQDDPVTTWTVGAGVTVADIAPLAAIDPPALSAMMADIIRCSFYA